MIALPSFRAKAPWFVVALLGMGLVAAILRLAWLSDDAYITLRTVENLLAGHGPVWNVGERVQTYTHPAWFWLLALARWLSGEHYFTTIALSVLLTTIGVVMLAVMARSGRAIVLLLLVLLGSRAFGDFATSGLETPLVTVLLVWLGWIDHRTPHGEQRLLPIAFVVGLCGLTRLDLLCLVGPMLLAHLRKDRLMAQLAQVLLAMSPLIGWSLFATWYYGSPFAITAYAKAFSPGIPKGDLLAQGVRYFAHTATHDPLTLVTIAGGMVVGFAVRDVRGRMLALGMVLGCIYVASVGGDFMSGRFFMPTFVAACVLLARWLRTAPPAAAWFLGALVVLLVSLSGKPAWSQSPAADLPIAAEHGIVDERRYYYRGLGLFSPKREIPVAGRMSRALARQGRQRPILLAISIAGNMPFVAGPQFHFIDTWLCDPLMMRLPALTPERWRIGHFTRGIPDGYPESLAFGDNRLLHAGLRRYYESLRTVLRAPLDSADRSAALPRLLFGSNIDGLRDYVVDEYRQPQRRALALIDMATPAAVGTFWFDDPTVRCIGRGGLRMTCVTTQKPQKMIVHVTRLVHYHFVFRRNGQEVARVELPTIVDPGLPPRGDDGDMLGYLQGFVGLHRFEVPMPDGPFSFDAIDVDVEHPAGIQAALGSIVLER